MNIRRGFFRLWVIGAAAWVLVYGVIITVFIYQEKNFEPWLMLLVPVVLVGPPAIVYVLGRALLWAFAGFSDVPSKR